MIRSSGVVCLVGVVLAVVVGCSGLLRRRGPVELFVGPGGNDAWPGRSRRRPFATLGRARDELRRLKAQGELDHGAVVRVLPGTYHLAKTFTLGPEDSGTAEAPIVYRGEGAHLAGGRPLGGFEPYRGKILQCDLKANGLAGRGFAQLFFRGRRQVLARYPNLDPSDPHGGKWAHVAFAPGGNNRTVFHYGSDESHTWAHPEEGRVHIFGGRDWAFSVVGIARHVPAERKIVLKGRTWQALAVGDRYYVDGLFEELDSPGEWYRDPRTDTLYFWPPDEVRDGDVVVPVVENAVELDGVEHVVFRGFTVEMCEGDGIRARNCREVLVAGNEVRNCGRNGIVVEGGSHTGARSNHVHHTGHGGIVISGGDRKSLEPGRNFADNNYIHHCGRIWKTYRPGVSVRGVGNTVSHNLIHDLPHAGILLNGNDNVVEFNIVHHVNLESADTGGIYFCSRDWTRRGNIIRYNIFHHVGGFGKENSWAPVRDGKVKFVYPHFTWGIYLDDPTSGTHVCGNILYSVPMCALHNHGGRDNVWENNIIVDCPALNAGQLSPTWSEWPAIFRRLRENRRPGSPYLERYPEIAKIGDARPEAMTGLRFRRNIVCFTRKGTAWLRRLRAQSWGGENRQVLYQLRIHAKDFDPAAFDYNCIWFEEGLEPVVRFQLLPERTRWLTWDEWRKTGADAHSVVADPGFVSLEGRDFRLKVDSPVLRLGFEPIPVEKIGLYRDEFRAEWPVREAPGVAALGDFTTVRYYQPPQYRRLEAVERSLRGGLPNFFAKAKAGRDLKVAYFGGGIHPGGGWRAKVIEWLNRNVGKTREIDASICDCVRGLPFSVYRFRHDVLAHKPDLVVVDYASDDQRTSPDTIARCLEGIVRQGWAADPTLDFLFLYAFRGGDEAHYSQGLFPHHVSAYERVAAHYGIPSVCPALRVARLVGEGKMLVRGDPEDAKRQKKLLFAPDGIRPTATADAIYAEAIAEFFASARGEAAPKPHALPPPLRADNLERARQVPIAPAMLSGKWERLPPTDPLARRFARHFDAIWFTSTPGSKLRFTFRGTEASIFDLMGPDTGRMVVRVDGHEMGIREQVDRWAYYQRLAAVRLASGLPEGTHTVEVELLAEPPGRSVAIEAAKRLGRYDPKAFEGVALRFGFIRLVGELVERGR